MMPDVVRVDLYKWLLTIRCRICLPDVTDTQLLYLLLLGTYMSPDGSEGRPGIKRLKACTSKNEKTAQRQLDKSRKEGLIDLVSRGGRHGDGKVVASVYAASLPVTVPPCPGHSDGDDTKTAVFDTMRAPSTGHPDVLVSPSDRPPLQDTQMSDGGRSTGHPDVRLTPTSTGHPNVRLTTLNRTFGGSQQDTQMSTHPPDTPKDTPPRFARGGARTQETIKRKIVDEEASPASRPSQGTRIPNDWVPDPELKRWTLAQGLTSEQARRELNKFRAWYRTKTGRQGLSADWGESWKIWVYRVVERTADKGSPNGTKRSGRQTDGELDDILARDVARVEVIEGRRTA